VHGGGGGSGAVKASTPMETYVVGFRIFDAKALDIGDEKECDPFIIVECCGKEYRTATLEKKKQLAPFNESCVWPDLSLFKDQFESGEIVFSVYARNWFTRNYLIGQASLQLSYINKRANCLYARRWLCLRKDGDPNTTGMLNVSVFALMPGQQAPSATLQEQEEQAPTGGEGEGQTDDADMLSKAVLDSTVQRAPGKAHHLEINIYRVQDLPTTKGVAVETEPSPYVTVEFAGSLLKTETRENARSCTFNVKMTIPVETPLYQDTIILKLWNARWGQHELMAKGLISFSELRNNALPPRWFNLYGWNRQEIPDLEALQGLDIEPNYFMGRILVSGRVNPLDDDEEMQPAKRSIANSAPEPNVRMVVLLADVYLVIGADGRQCEVELSYCATSQKTQCVPKDARHKADSGPGGDDEEEAQHSEEVKSFTFKEANGRIAPMLVMSPEDPESRPLLLINVYTYDLMGNRRRVGYTMQRLEAFSEYEPRRPSRPKFYPLTPMPGAVMNPVSVLITVECSRTEDIARHARSMVKPMMYVVRTYAFLARNIEFETQGCTYALRAVCAGRSKETAFKSGPRPRFMRAINLDVLLYSDSQKAPPVIEPICLELLEKRGSSIRKIGSATCVYTHMRQKSNTGVWQPYVLQPQWVKINGTSFGAQVVGEALIAFELLLYKFKRELEPADMMPKPDPEYNRMKHFCRLRKATLHFSLLGLRDLLPMVLAGGLQMRALVKPMVEVEVAWGDEDHNNEAIEDGASGDKDPQALADEGSPARKRPKKLVFKYEPVIENGDVRLRSDRLENWSVEVKPGVKGTSFEFLQVQELQVEIPDKMILQPYIKIRVYEEPSSEFGAWVREKLGAAAGDQVGHVNTFIGESRRSLAEVLPCCWFDNIKTDKKLAEQMDVLEHEIKKAKEESRVHNHFREPTEADLKKMMKRVQQQAKYKDAEGEKLSSSIEDMLRRQMDDADADGYVNSTGLPKPIRESKRKRELNIYPIDNANVQKVENFGTRKGDELVASAGRAAKMISGKMEHLEPGSKTFKNDFYFKAFPLMKHKDVIDRDDKTDWGFWPGTVGYVKCAFKLVDGWHKKAKDTGEDTSDDEDDKSKPVEKPDWEEHKRVHRSYGLDDELDSFAFDQKALRKRFKSMPSRVRLRLYLIKAVCIYSSSRGYPDPYVEFQLGKEKVSNRNSAQPNTDEPDFYMTEERDIVLPDDSRLEVRIMDKVAFGTDAVIGGTIIDLEDRWHSKNWQAANERQEVPKESRPMSTRDEPGKNRGTIEMWIEMLDCQKTVDVKVSPLVKPVEIELEVRMVIWTTKNVKFVKGKDYVNVKVISSLDCGSYLGMDGKTQETDVHYNSKDGNAIFNWRIVYSRIKMPIKTCSVKLDLVHYELMGSTVIGSLDLDLKKYVERVATNMDAIELAEDWLKFKDSEAADDEDIGQAKVQLFVLTQIEAGSKRAGIGREDPNDYPPLITPAEGRDWGDYFGGNPFKLPEFGMWKKMIPLFIIMVIFLFFVIIMKQMGLL